MGITYSYVQSGQLRHRAIDAGVPHNTEAPEAVEISGVSVSTKRPESVPVGVSAQESTEVYLAFCHCQMRRLRRGFRRGPAIPYDTPLEIAGMEELVREIANRNLSGPNITLRALVESNGKFIVRFQGIKSPEPVVSYPAGIP